MIQLYIYMYLLFFKFFSQLVVLEYWAEFSALHSKSLLAIHLQYSSGYMSIPNSLAIPPPHPSPLVTMSVFSKSVSLFLFYTKVHLYLFFFLKIPHISDIWYFFLCLTCFLTFNMKLWDMCGQNVMRVYSGTAHGLPSSAKQVYPCPTHTPRLPFLCFDPYCFLPLLFLFLI